jgi:hypothetical protein
VKEEVFSYFLIAYTVLKTNHFFKDLSYTLLNTNEKLEIIYSIQSDKSIWFQIELFDFLKNGHELFLLNYSGEKNQNVKELLYCYIIKSWYLLSW